MAECPVSYLSKVMAISNETCLLIGGAIDIKQTKVFPYVFQANQDGNLERKTNMLQARAAFGCHLDKASKRVYVIGGSINQDEATDQCEVYDIKKDKWSPLPSLDVNICSSSAITLGEFEAGSKYLFSFGGITKNEGELNIISNIFRLDLEF